MIQSAIYLPEWLTNVKKFLIAVPGLTLIKGKALLYEVEGGKQGSLRRRILNLVSGPASENLLAARQGIGA
jgi:hypothetical protein